MPDILHEPEPNAKAGKVSPVTIFLGAIVLLAIALSVRFLLKPPVDNKAITSRDVVPGKMAPAELDYAKHVQVEKLALSREENFLHQLVTTLSGEVVNSGTQPIVGLMLTIEFHDTMNQIVLRETRGVLGMRPAPLAPGERRTFEIAFDNIPPSWDMQQPSLRLARLQLADSK